ncbi:MAG: hypothetical protein IKQ70_01795 [Bacteroidales bacterium]|nr:hypothetical protein [Bacteroidales bacterium]
MKRRFLLPIAALMAAAIMIAGCKKDDEDNTPKFTKKDSAEVISLFQKSPYVIIKDLYSILNSL